MHNLYRSRLILSRTRKFDISKCGFLPNPRARVDLVAIRKQIFDATGLKSTQCMCMELAQEVALEDFKTINVHTDMTLTRSSQVKKTSRSHTHNI